MARNLLRLTLNFSVDLVSQIDEYAKMIGISRTAAISVLCSQALSAYRLTDSMSYAVNQDRQEKSKLELK